MSGNLLDKVLQFGAGIIIVRLISKSEYGVWSYAFNILSIFLLVSGAGATSAILQYCSRYVEDPRRYSYFKYGMRMSFLTNVLIGVCLFISTYVFIYPVPGTNALLRVLCVMPLLNVLVANMKSYLRATLRNKQFSYLNVLSSLFWLVGMLVGGWFFKTAGLAAARNATLLMALAVAIVFIRNDIKLTIAAPILSSLEIRQFIRYSLICVATNALSQLLSIADVFLVGLFFKDGQAVASYKTATLIPFNLYFIPGAIIVFAYPYFAQRKDDPRWIIRKSVEVQVALAAVNGTITLVLVLFAPLIIGLVFGKNYLDAVPAFQVLCLAFFVGGTFRTLAGNLLAAMELVEFNLINAVLMGIVTIGLDILLIRALGSLGAALSSLIVICLDSIVSLIYLYWHLRRVLRAS